MNEARSRLQVGVDVPWVTSWTEERVTGLERCAEVGGEWALRQAEGPGRGRPQYALNHFRRQRASVARMLCPMCGRRTDAADRWLLTATTESAGALRSRGLGRALPAAVEDARQVVNAGTIAPGHRRCLAEAAQRCPDLHDRRDAALIPFPALWVTWPLWVEAGDWSPSSGVPRPPPAVAFLQICGLTPMNRKQRAVCGSVQPR